MKVTVRAGVPADAPSFVCLKERLRMPPGTQTRRGGFVLGTSLEQYGRHLSHDQVIVAEALEGLVGFSIVLKHDRFVNSELWKKKDAARLTLPPQALAGRRVAYYEQLAFMPGYAARVYAKYVAFINLYLALQDHGSVVATVVRKPVHNRAALPFLSAAGFQWIGSIDEHYPEYGAIGSDIYHLDSDDFVARLERPSFASLIRKARARGLMR
ncbi:MAG: hypothetical protein M3511_01545 [Deinococcota bacterium]|nr:hypothetical protein [Deinococcota bacterium]